MDDLLMKIIIPVLGFGKSGGYRVLSNLSNYLIKNGCSVTFVAPEYSPEPYYPTSARVISVASRFENIKILRVVFAALSIFSQILKFDEGCVIANHNLTSFIVVVLPRRFRKYYYVQAYEVNLVSGLFSKFLAYLSYFLPLRKIVNSEKILPERVKNIVGCVPAGIDFNVFYESSEVFSKSKTIRIGCIGRKERYKGTFEIIEAFSEIAKKYDAILQVAIYLPKCDFNANDKIVYRPITNDTELSDFYKSNDIIVATGLIEYGAFHYPCAEGMAVGRLVISNYSPLTDRLDAVNPQLRLERVNKKSIVEALDFAINMNSSKQLEEIAINNSIIRQYSWNCVGLQFLDIISES
ncbi:glycosyltransferase family 4 protein [Shewanella sp.]|uniref:glycosyltransferase family 4 protein n=1 Tax=Shewanella sp. TaxID=50422 RepID=UPI003A97DE94